MRFPWRSARLADPTGSLRFPTSALHRHRASSSEALFVTDSGSNAAIMLFHPDLYQEKREILLRKELAIAHDPRFSGSRVDLRVEGPETDCFRRGRMSHSASGTCWDRCLHRHGAGWRAGWGGLRGVVLNRASRRCRTGGGTLRNLPCCSDWARRLCVRPMK